MGVKIIADWIPHMEAYRLYDPQNPQQAIAYVDDPKEAEDRGYEVIINDSDTEYEQAERVQGMSMAFRFLYRR